MRQRDPLEPAASTVRVTLALVAVLVALVTVGSLVSTGSFFGVGDASACAEERNGRVRVPQGEANVVLDAVDGVTSSTSTVWLCTDSPTAGQEALELGVHLPRFLLLVVALGLAVRLVRGMRQHGIFTETTARRLRSLGWLVLAGQVVAALVESLAHHLLVSSLVTWDVPADWWLPADLSVLSLLLGAVLVTFGRVMTISSAMREELDETV